MCVVTRHLWSTEHIEAQTKWKLISLDKISLKFVPRGPITNIPTLVQIMAWRRPDDKTLSESLMVILLTHICVTQPEWVNLFRPSDACMRRWTGSSLVQIMACHLFGAKQLSEPMLEYWIFRNKLRGNFNRNSNIFSFKKLLLKMSSAKRRLFCLGLNELNGNMYIWMHH